MSFTEPVFLLFFPAVLLLSRPVPGRHRWMLLLPASYLFYAWHDLWLLGLILLTTLTSYLCALGMDGASQKRKKGLLALDLAVCLGVLFLFKYLGMALNGVSALAGLFGAELSFGAVRVLLPMGISFYTFQTMSYAIDVYRGTVPAERHLGYYALFVSFFPQLVAGPIERPVDLLPQLKAPAAPDEADLSEGLRDILRGYVKKVLIADYLAPFVDAAYADPAAAGGGAVCLATVLFAVQICCDFSGYSDIAVGCARLMGVRLSENFRRPYAAGSVREFWRRWHTSLTRWFTDYLYIPLGGSRRGRVRQCINILIVFLVSGLWHGADVTFVIWGGLHGLYLTAETLILGDREPSSAAGRLLHRILTLLAVGFAWIFFRAGSLPDALTAVRAVFAVSSPAGMPAGLAMSGSELLTAGLLICLLPLAERLPALPAGRGREQARTGLLWALLILCAVFCRCLALTGQGAPSFIYFQF